MHVNPGRLWTLLLFLIFAVSAPAALATDITRVQGPGGIEAWLVQEHSIPLISVQIGFRGGASMDPEGKAGLANIVSGLLDEGAGDLNSSAFQQRLEDRAIRLGFNASMDRFSGHMMTLSENRDEAFRLLGMALGSPRFDPEPIERIRRQITVSLRHKAEDPSQIANLAWYKHLFGNHPYGRAIDGTEESLSRVTTQDMRDFARKWFTKDNLYVTVVGDIDPGTLKSLLNSTFGTLPETGNSHAGLKEAKVVSTGEVRVIERDIPQSVVAFGQDFIKRDHPDWYSAYVLNYILGGGGFASRLMTEVREKRGLAYSVGSYLHPYERAGLLVGHVATENARVNESIDIIRNEIGKMRDTGPTEEELANAKTYITGSFPLSLDSNRKIARYLLMIQLRGLGIDYIENRNKKIDAVSLQDVRRVAKTLLDPDKLVFVVVGSPDGIASDETN